MVLHELDSEASTIFKRISKALNLSRELTPSDRETLLAILSGNPRPELETKIVEVSDCELASGTAALESIDQTRLQMVAVAAAARSRDVSLIETFMSQDPDVAPPFGAIEQFAGGVKTCNAFGSQIIILPEPLTNLHCWQILNALNRIYLSAPRSGGWIVDCSAINAQEALIYSSLLGYKKALSREPGGLRLIWVHPDSLPPLIEHRLVTEFQLSKVGAHYFTRV